MVQIQLNTSLKSFISLAIALNVLHQNVNAAVFGSWELEKLSPSAQVVYTNHPGTDMNSFLGESKRNFDQLHEKILGSVEEGNIIHVEDGQADDILHDVLSVFAGRPPKDVYMHNGFYKLRAAAADTTWGYLAEKGGIQKPGIFSIRGGTEDDMVEFDHAEGIELLDPHIINELKAQSINSPTYVRDINKARSRLEKTLQENPFTTIVLKTAPGGLTEVLKEYRNKVAIIWTGPIRKLTHSEGWEVKFNYKRAYEDTDKLIELGIPIVIVSPYVGNARMMAIIDKKFKNEYSDFVSLPQDYPGFSKMATMRKNENALISNYINAHSERFMVNVIHQLQETQAKLKMEKAQLKSAKSRMSPEDYRQKYLDLKSKEASSTALGTRWNNLLGMKKDGAQFREYCPVDLFAATITDRSLQSSVKEVMQVQMQRLDDLKIDVMPNTDSKIFVVSHLDSQLLENQFQKVINWMDAGEPHFGPHSASTS